MRGGSADGIRSVPATLRYAHSVCRPTCAYPTLRSSQSGTGVERRGNEGASGREMRGGSADGIRSMPATLRCAGARCLLLWENRMIFELFDPKAETTVHEGSNLPHWFQAGVTYFVTFRTEDSIPADAARTLASPPRGLAAAARGRRRSVELEGRLRPASPRGPAAVSRDVFSRESRKPGPRIGPAIAVRRAG